MNNTVSTKVCSKCGEEKSVDMFYKNKSSKDGLYYQCKSCHIGNAKSYQKKVQGTNEFKNYRKEYYKKNPLSKKNSIPVKYNPERYQSNKENILASNKRYYQSNKENIINQQCKYVRTRMQSDVKFCISRLIRTSMNNNFRRYSKNGKAYSCLKYGIDFAAIFEKIGPKPEGNFHIDHIIPISKFDLDNALHVRLAHHPENLRWLDAIKNIQKSDSIDFSLISTNPILVDIAKQIGIME